MIAAPLLVWLIGQHYFRAALSTVLIAGLTDWFDGYAARKLGAAGTIGVVLDPLADKALLIAAYVAMGYFQLIPFWLFALVVGRDLVIVVGALLLRWLRNQRRFLPLTMGKVSTFFQIVLAFLTLVYAAFPFWWIRWLQLTGMGLTAIFTAWSGFQYIQRGITLAREEPAKSK